MVKKTSILDGPKEVLQKHLEQTGQTEAELRAEIERFETEDATPIEGADPTQKKKFTQDPGFEVVETGEE